MAISAFGMQVAGLIALVCISTMWNQASLPSSQTSSASDTVRADSSFPETASLSLIQRHLESSRTSSSQREMPTSQLAGQLDSNQIQPSGPPLAQRDSSPAAAGQAQPATPASVTAGQPDPGAAVDQVQVLAASGAPATVGQVSTGGASSGTGDISLSNVADGATSDAEAAEVEDEEADRIAAQDAVNADAASRDTLAAEKSTQEPESSDPLAPKPPKKHLGGIRGIVHDVLLETFEPLIEKVESLEDGIDKLPRGQKDAGLAVQSLNDEIHLLKDKSEEGALGLEKGVLAAQVKVDALKGLRGNFEGLAGADDLKQLQGKIAKVKGKGSQGLDRIHKVTAKNTRYLKAIYKDLHHR